MLVPFQQTIRSLIQWAVISSLTALKPSDLTQKSSEARLLHVTLADSKPFEQRNRDLSCTEDRGSKLLRNVGIFL
jgi:hypothetical protein